MQQFCSQMFWCCAPNSTPNEAEAVEQDTPEAVEEVDGANLTNESRVGGRVVGAALGRSVTTESQVGGRGVGRRGKRGGAGIEEVGQTNSAVVGSNFMRMMLRASVQKRNPTHFDDLKTLGFDSVADELEPLIGKNNEPDARRMHLWKTIAQIYTKEESGDIDRKTKSNKSVYRELNRALRTDDDTLWLWADYYAVLNYGGIFGAGLPPPEVLPHSPQTTFRGFAMKPDLARRYRKGDIFFWQTFVSTSKDLGQSIQFAKRDCEKGQVPFIFHLDLPKYQESRFWAFELSTLSIYADEDEVLLPPYTQFKVTKDPSEDADNGTTNIYMKVISQPFTRELQRITVLIDPNGFDSGESQALARLTFTTGMPKFRRYKDADIIDDPRMPSGSFYDYGVLPRCLDGVALFTNVQAALEWIREQLIRGSIQFRFLMSGTVSEQFMPGFFQNHPGTPCEACIYCQNVEKWQDYWKDAPRMRITDNLETAKDYLTHEGYDEFGNKIMKILDLIGQSYRGTQVWYPYTTVKHGVVYGGAGMYRDCMGEGWLQGTGQFPNVPMAPFEKC